MSVYPLKNIRGNKIAGRDRYCSIREGTQAIYGMYMEIGGTFTRSLLTIWRKKRKGVVL